MNRLTVFSQVTALDILQHIFILYRVTDKIYVEKNATNMMGLYDPAKSLARLINQLQTNLLISRAGRMIISDTMMMPKGITLLAQTATFNYDIRTST